MTRYPRLAAMRAAREREIQPEVGEARASAAREREQTQYYMNLWQAESYMRERLEKILADKLEMAKVAATFRQFFLDDARRAIKREIMTVLQAHGAKALQDGTVMVPVDAGTLSVLHDNGRFQEILNWWAEEALPKTKLSTRATPGFGTEVQSDFITILRFEIPGLRREIALG